MWLSASSVGPKEREGSAEFLKRAGYLFPPTKAANIPESCPKIRVLVCCRYTRSRSLTAENKNQSEEERLTLQYHVQLTAFTLDKSWDPQRYKSTLPYRRQGVSAMTFQIGTQSSVPQIHRIVCCKRTSRYRPTPCSPLLAGVDPSSPFVM